MNAIEMLSQDHQHLRQLLKQLVATGQDQTKAPHDLVARLKHDLAVHTRLEEEIFYPAFAQAAGEPGDAMRFEALEEHRIIDQQALPDLMGTPAKDPAFAGRALALKRLVELHLGQEEREMFAQARKVMGGDQLDGLGQAMRQARAKWIAKGWPGNGDEAPTPPHREEDAIAQGLHWFSEQVHRLEERGERMATEFAKDPAHQIGRGVEQAVGVGARLAGEVVGGIRRGLEQSKVKTPGGHTQEKQRHHQD